MVQLTSLKCAECGAALTLSPNEREARCPYCGASSLVTVKSREAPKEDPFDEQFEGRRVAPLQTPAKGGKSGRILIGLIVALVLGALGLTVFAVLVERPIHATRDTTEAFLEKAKSTLTRAALRFRGQPLLGNVNDDDAPDIIGRCDDRIHESTCAFDGKTGELLWKSADSTPAQKDSATKRAVVGDRIILIDSLGKLQALQLKDGTPIWAAVLAETTADVCQLGELALITTTDGAKTAFALDTGTKTPVPKGKCSPVWLEHSETNPEQQMIGWANFAANNLPSLHSVPEMSSHRALIPSEPGLRFLLGSKAKGSSVAMVAAVEKKKVLWKDIVPGTDPLGTTVNVTTQLATYQGGSLAVPYDLKGSTGTRMAAFEGRTGKRLWDIEVHKASQVSSGIASTKEFIYYTSWTALYAYRWSDGGLAFQIGAPI